MDDYSFKSKYSDVMIYRTVFNPKEIIYELEDSDYFNSKIVIKLPSKTIIRTKEVLKNIDCLADRLLAFKDSGSIYSDKIIFNDNKTFVEELKYLNNIKGNKNFINFIEIKDHFIGIKDFKILENILAHVGPIDKDFSFYKFLHKYLGYDLLEIKDKAFLFRLRFAQMALEKRTIIFKDHKREVGNDYKAFSSLKSPLLVEESAEEHNLFVDDLLKKDELDLIKIKKVSEFLIDSTDKFLDWTENKTFEEIYLLSKVFVRQQGFSFESTIYDYVLENKDLIDDNRETISRQSNSKIKNNSKFEKQFYDLSELFSLSLLHLENNEEIFSLLELKKFFNIKETSYYNPMSVSKVFNSSDIMSIWVIRYIYEKLGYKNALKTVKVFSDHSNKIQNLFNYSVNFEDNPISPELAVALM